jgi:membrane protease YdiL (CAAX protease family)
MERLNIASFVFLVVLFVLTPRAALRSARQLRQAAADGTPIPRGRIALSTMLALVVVWVISVLNADAMGRNLFAPGPFGARELGIGLAGFAALLLAIPISIRMRTPEEQRRRLMHSMAPRQGRELLLFALVAVMAGISEESSYRGVAIWILTPIFGGNIYPAIFLSAMAFAVAHAVQGGKTMAMIFVVALVLQAVVQLTHTLVIAMLVHMAYDVVAGVVAGRRARALDQEAAPVASGPSG